MNKPLEFLYYLVVHKMTRFLCFVNEANFPEKLFNFAMDTGGTTDSKICYLSKANAKQHKDLIQKYTDGEIDGIISTEQLSRGMDINFNIVFNYDSTLKAKYFVHRSGRCGRAGRKGN